MTRRLFAAALVFAGCAPANVAVSTGAAASHPYRDAHDPTTTSTTAAASTAPRVVRPRPTRDHRRHVSPPVVAASGEGTSVSSTAYCLTGAMANGARVYVGAVAGNRWPLGTVLHVSDSPYGPRTFVVADRIGHGSDLDFAIPGDCALARAWGRRRVTVEVAP